jgi:hypothetical protein
MFLILGNYVRRVSENRKYFIKRLKVYGLVAFDVQSDSNLPTISNKMLSSSLGTRQYVLSKVGNILSSI